MPQITATIATDSDAPALPTRAGRSEMLRRSDEVGVPVQFMTYPLLDTSNLLAIQRLDRVGHSAAPIFSVHYKIVMVTVNYALLCPRLQNRVSCTHALTTSKHLSKCDRVLFKDGLSRAVRTGRLDTSPPSSLSQRFAGAKTCVRMPTVVIGARR